MSKQYNIASLSGLCKNFQRSCILRSKTSYHVSSFYFYIPRYIDIHYLDSGLLAVSFYIRYERKSFVEDGLSCYIEDGVVYCWDILFDCSYRVYKFVLADYLI